MLYVNYAGFYFSCPDTLTALVSFFKVIHLRKWYLYCLFLHNAFVGSLSLSIFLISKSGLDVLIFPVSGQCFPVNNACLASIQKENEVFPFASVGLWLLIVKTRVSAFQLMK